MERAVLEVMKGGARRVVVIGSDCPALSAERIRRAFRELSNSAGAVFGPSGDGGYYLLGVGSAFPFLFRGIGWGGSSVLEESVSRCRDAGIPYALLPGESDVDTPEDLAALERWAAGHAGPPCPRTRRWLSGTFPSLPVTGKGIPSRSRG